MGWQVSTGRIEQVEPLYQMMQAAGRRMAQQGVGQWDEHYPTRELVEQDIRENALFVVMEEEEIRACFSLRMESIPQYAQIRWGAPQARFCVLHRLCVDPEQQGKGIGRRAMAMAEEVARERGFQAIRLEAFAPNTASLRVYESCGYQARGEIDVWGMHFICYEKKIV